MPQPEASERETEALHWRGHRYIASVLVDGIVVRIGLRAQSETIGRARLVGMGFQVLQMVTIRKWKLGAPQLYLGDCWGDG